MDRLFPDISGYVWLAVAILMFAVIPIAYWREIREWWKGWRQREKEFSGNGYPVDHHWHVSQPGVTVTLPPWGRPILRIRSMWRHWRHDRRQEFVREIAEQIVQAQTEEQTKEKGDG